MATSSANGTLLFLQSRTRALLGMLVAQFLLGMAVNLIGNPGSSVSKITEGIFLLLHVLIALSLVTLSVFVVRAAAKLGGPWPRLTRVGAAGVGLAFIGGIGVMASSNTLSQWLSYLMSIGFIAAFSGYGFLFAKLTAATSTVK